MYSLIITIQSISFVSELAVCSTSRHQYGLCVEVALGLDEDYKIPSLIWPPPSVCQFRTSSLTTRKEACHD